MRRSSELKRNALQPVLGFTKIVPNLQFRLATKENASPSWTKARTESEDSQLSCREFIKINLGTESLESAFRLTEPLRKESSLTASLTRSEESFTLMDQSSKANSKME